MCLAIRNRKIKRVCIDHAPSLATQIFLPRRFPKRQRRGFLVLGDMPQAKADGSEIMGPRLPVLQRRATGRKTGPGRFPEWLVDGGWFEFLFRRRIANIETTQYSLRAQTRELIRSAWLERKLLALKICGLQNDLACKIAHGTKRYRRDLHGARIKR